MCSETAVICSYWYVFRVSLKSAPRYIKAMRLGCFFVCAVFFLLFCFFPAELQKKFLREIIKCMPFECRVHCRVQGTLLFLKIQQECMKKFKNIFCFCKDMVQIIHI